MIPHLNRADIDAIEARTRGLWAEAAQRRLLGEVPEVYRGRDWGISRRQAVNLLVVLAGIVLLLFWAGPAVRPFLPAPVDPTRNRPAIVAGQPGVTPAPAPVVLDRFDPSGEAAGT